MNRQSSFQILLIEYSTVLYNTVWLFISTYLHTPPRNISTIFVTRPRVPRDPPPLPSGSGDISVPPNLVGDALRPKTRSLEVAGSPQSIRLGQNTSMTGTRSLRNRPRHQDSRRHGLSRQGASTPAASAGRIGAVAVAADEGAVGGEGDRGEVSAYEATRQPYGPRRCGRSNSDGHGDDSRG